VANSPKIFWSQLVWNLESTKYFLNAQKNEFILLALLYLFPCPKCGADCFDTRKHSNTDSNMLDYIFRWAIVRMQEDTMVRRTSLRRLQKANCGNSGIRKRLLYWSICQWPSWTTFWSFCYQSCCKVRPKRAMQWLQKWAPEDLSGWSWPPSCALCCYSWLAILAHALTILVWPQTL
jgi:hypothetical protein